MPIRPREDIKAPASVVDTFDNVVKTERSIASPLPGRLVKAMTAASCRNSSLVGARAHIAAWLVSHASPEAGALAQTLQDYDVHEPAITTAQVRELTLGAAAARDL